MNKKIFIACDTSNIKKVKEIIKCTQTKKLNIYYKFGLEFFYSKLGRYFFLKMDKKQKIFLDLKLNDIPNTCAAAVYSMKDLKNISYLTVHINGGFEMLKAIKKATKKHNRNMRILGVTILTSLNNSSIKEIGHTKSIKEIVKKQATIAKLAKLDGVVCSGFEARFLKKTCKGMEIITPGIRLPGDNKGDQKRVMTPKEAFRNGATSIVVGRSVTEGSVKNNIQKLIKSLN